MFSSVLELYSVVQDSSIKSVIVGFINGSAAEMNNSDFLSQMNAEAYAGLCGNSKLEKTEIIISSAVARGESITQPAVDKPLKDGRNAKIIRVNNRTGYANCFALFLVDYITGLSKAVQNPVLGIAFRENNASLDEFRNAVENIKTVFGSYVQIKTTEAFPKKENTAVPAEPAGIPDLPDFSAARKTPESGEATGSGDSGVMSASALAKEISRFATAKVKDAGSAVHRKVNDFMQPSEQNQAGYNVNRGSYAAQGGTAFCPGCGNRVVGDSVFCDKCGRRVN